MNRVWTYIISKPLEVDQLNELTREGQNFVSGWTAHEQQLHASFEIFEKRIIIVKVNEQMHAASGCSIDKLGRFIKDTETKYGIELLNRLLVAIKTKEGVLIVHASAIPEHLAKGTIDQNTIVFNTAAADENSLLQWEQPLGSTWLKKYLVKV